MPSTVLSLYGKHIQSQYFSGIYTLTKVFAFVSLVEQVVRSRIQLPQFWQ